MFYVYVLYSSKTKQLYTGYTQDLRQRMLEHNQGQGGTFTNRNKPYKLVYYEAFLTKSDARKQEIFLKSGYGREVLKDKLASSLEYIAGVVQQ